MLTINFVLLFLDNFSDIHAIKGIIDTNKNSGLVFFKYLDNVIIVLKEIITEVNLNFR